MTDEEQNLKDEYAKYTDDALRRIIYESPSDYEGFALEAASGELQKRFEMLLSNSGGDFISMYYLIKDTDFCEISDFVSLYIKKKSELFLYQNAYDKIAAKSSEFDCESSGQSNQTVLNIFLADEKNHCLENLDAVGKNLADNTEIDITFLTWGEWLNVSVQKDQILEFGKERILTVALIKMTANGFDENDTKNRLAEMESYVDAEKTADEADEDGGEQASEDYAQFENDFLAKGFMVRNSDYKRKRNPQIRPWVRYFARMIDYIYFAVLFEFVLKVVSPQAFQIYWSIKYISLHIILWIFVEAVLLSTFGATPGKWLLRVTVRDDDGNKLTFRKALLRSVFVWGVGDGLGISFLNVIMNVFSYFRLESAEKTLWDEKLQICVTHQKIAVWRYVLTAVLLLAAVAGSVVILELKRKGLIV